MNFRITAVTKTHILHNKILFTGKGARILDVGKKSRIMHLEHRGSHFYKFLYFVIQKHTREVKVSILISEYNAINPWDPNDNFITNLHQSEYNSG